MFNRTYQLRSRDSRPRESATPAFPGSKDDASLYLPWAGIFEPWRPFVAVARAAAGVNYQENAKTPRKRQLKGVQLDLFASQTVIPDPERPLFDLFPEAYL